MKSLPQQRIGVAFVALSIALIAAIIVPWRDLQDHSHWANVGWIPFVSPPIRIFDIAANLLLFAPLGASAALAFRRGVVAAAVLSLAVSLGGEYVQLYSHSRFPSATDVVCNVSGAVLAALARRRAQRA